MLRKRLITVLTFSDGVLFRTRAFTPDYRYTLNFVDAWSVDEIVILDVTRDGEGDREKFYKVVKNLPGASYRYPSAAVFEQSKMSVCCSRWVQIRSC